VPIVGDDIKSPGRRATIVHRVLTPTLSPTVACDWTGPTSSTFGGNTDFQNMLERDRLESKKISKTNAVTRPQK